jgi:hypothetical protein
MPVPVEAKGVQKYKIAEILRQQKGGGNGVSYSPYFQELCCTIAVRYDRLSVLAVLAGTKSPNSWLLDIKGVQGTIAEQVRQSASTVTFA